MLVSTNAVFLEEDYMIDRKALENVVLEEIQEQSIPNIRITKLEENLPALNPIVTPELRCGRRIVRPPNKFMLLGETYEVVPEEHEQDHCNYDETMSDQDSGH